MGAKQKRKNDTTEKKRVIEKKAKKVIEITDITNTASKRNKIIGLKANGNSIVPSNSRRILRSDEQRKNVKETVRNKRTVKIIHEINSDKPPRLTPMRTDKTKVYRVNSDAGKNRKDSISKSKRKKGKMYPVMNKSNRKKNTLPDLKECWVALTKDEIYNDNFNLSDSEEVINNGSFKINKNRIKLNMRKKRNKVESETDGESSTQTCTKQVKEASAKEAVTNYIDIVNKSFETVNKEVNIFRTEQKKTLVLSKIDSSPEKNILSIKKITKQCESDSENISTAINLGCLIDTVECNKIDPLSPQKCNISSKASLDKRHEKGYIVDDRINIQKCHNNTENSSNDVTRNRENCSSSSESEWEEVADTEPALDIEDYKPEIPQDGVEIVLNSPRILEYYRKKKKEYEMFEYIRLMINRFRKHRQLTMHKVHLLCYVAHGLYLNDILNEPILRGIALSLIPNELLKLTQKEKKIDIDVIKKVVKWFQESFSKKENFDYSVVGVRQTLESNFKEQKASNVGEYVMMFVIIARVLQMKTRLCFSLYPVPIKATDLLKKSMSKLYKKFANNERASCIECKEERGENSKNICNDIKLSMSKNARKKKHIVNEKKFNNLAINSNLDETVSTDKNKSFLKKAVEKKTKRKNLKLETNESESKKSSRKVNNQRKQPRRSVSKKSYKLSSDEDIESDDEYVPKDGEVSESSDEDFVSEKEILDENIKKKLLKEITVNRCKRKSQIKVSSRKILSSDSEDVVIEKGIELWAEIYSKPQKKWIPVDCFYGILDKPYGIEDLATQPVSYVIAFDNQSYVKDVSMRYCLKWMTHTRKLRTDPQWWMESLKPFMYPNAKEQKEEDKQLEAILINMPMPSTISAFKDHPLYALRRHLLKFEAIYPPDAPPLGYIRKEPIYARECVFILRGEKEWLKDARVICKGEQPYKIVKAQPTWDRIAKRIVTDLPLDLYGHWQTEDYVPPTAKNGKVPRNGYGNVELFQPSMLPKGTVHLQIPGLNRVARKLEIDCAAAVVGYEDGGCGKQPVFDGWVICKEFKKKLLEAWGEEQEIRKKKKQEEREKHAYGNWRKLIKNLLIRERIKIKYPSY